MVKKILTLIICWIRIHGAYYKDFIRCIKLDDKRRFDRNSYYVFIFFCADYYNLGDVAITKAQYEFIQKHISKKYEIVCIPNDRTYSSIIGIKKLDPDKVVITLIGGGNSGNIYEFIERKRRLVLKIFNNYKIISFPQSIFWSNDVKGKIYKNEFRKVCRSCKNLTLVAREQVSYKVYQITVDTNKIKLLLTPDIVFSLENRFSNGKIRVHNSGRTVLIFRDDKERKVKNEDVDEIKMLLQKHYRDICEVDTCGKNEIVDYYSLLSEFLDFLHDTDLVVTDRLHGMIFCYVLGIPCIAIGNNNYKIQSTYSTWLNNCNYIKYLDNFSIVEFNTLINCLKNIDKMIKGNAIEYNFKSLVDQLRE